MPRGPAPAWRARKQPVVDEYILASVTQAGGLGKHDGNGHYARLVIRDLKTREEADEWKRALHRCAHYLARTGQADVSMSSEIKRVSSGYIIEFHAVDKTHARKYMLEKYGPDRSKWPYDPRRRNHPQIEGM